MKITQIVMLAVLGCCLVGTGLGLYLGIAGALSTPQLIAWLAASVGLSAILGRIAYHDFSKI